MDVGRLQKNKGHRRPDPIDVLEGRVPIDVDQLLDLIHEVNPTGSDLGKEARRRRYDIKNRLQSLLLRRYGSQACVSAEPARDGDLLIRIDLREGMDNACHCLLSGLDEDVRTQLRRRFDEEADAAARGGNQRVKTGPRPGPDPGRARRARTSGPRAPEEAPAESEDLDDLVLGRRAQDAYDYEAARLHYVRALDQAIAASSGGVEEAVALLTLLVDLLAADRDALDLMDQLPAETRADGEVCLLLGLAAARCGEPGLAEDLGEDLTGRRAAAIFVTLAGQALAAGDLSAVERHLLLARQRDPSEPEIGRIEAEFFRLRADERAPLEAEVTRLIAAQEFAAAEERAQALVARWPESEVGRKTLRQLAELRRRQEAAALAAQAVQDLKSGQRGAALHRLREALRTGVQGEEREQLVATIALLEEHERKRQAEDKIAEAVVLVQKDPQRGLLFYLGLPAALQKEIRERTGLREFTWLEQIEDARPGTAPRVAVDGVMAVHQAARLCESNPEAALGLIAAHERLLDPIADVRNLAANARRLFQDQRVDRSIDQLTAIGTAVKEGRFAEAYPLVQEIDWRVVPEDVRPTAMMMAELVQTECQQQPIRDHFLHLLSKNEWLAARDLADAQIATTTGRFQESWTALRKQADVAVQYTFAVRISRGPGPAEDAPDADADACDRLPQVRPVHRWLLPEPGLMLLTQCCLYWIFLRIVDYRTGQVQVRASLRTPECMEAHEVVVDEASVWLLGKLGAVLQLSLPDFRVLRWLAAERCSGIKDRTKEKPLQDIMLGPDGRHLWLGYDTEFVEQKTCIIDVDRPHVRRDLGLRQWCMPLRGGTQPLVCAPKKSDTLIVCSPLGTVLREVRLPEQELLSSVAPHPSGKGLLCLTRKKAGGTRPVCWLEVGDDGTAGEPRPIVATDVAFRACCTSAIADEVRTAAIVTSLNRRLSFVRLDLESAEEGCGALCALSPHGPDGGGLALLDQTIMPFPYLLLQDASSRRVVYLLRTAEGPRGMELGEGPSAQPLSDLPMSMPAPHMVVPWLLSVDSCCALLPTDGGEAEGLLERLLDEKPETRKEMMQEMGARRDPAVLLDLLALLDAGGERGLRGELAEGVVQHHPGLYGAKMALADERAARGKWDEVRALIEDPGADRLDGRLSRHRHHLLALCAVAAKDGETALHELRQAALLGIAAREEGLCQLDELRALCTPLPQPLRSTDWDTEHPVVRQLLGAILTADRHLLRGEPFAVLQALHRPLFLFQAEIQSLSRLAEAYLGLELSDPVQDFRKRLCLARFCQAWGDWMCGTFRQLPILWPQIRMWDADRIRDLINKARAFLDSGKNGPEEARTYRLDDIRPPA